LAQINPDIRLTEYPDRLADSELAKAVGRADIVLDGCDNFTTRFQVNDACVKEQRVLVSGAAIRFEGQLAVFGPDYGESPCYRCLYEEADESLDNCSGNGVLAAVPGVIGTMMAVETLKFLSGVGINSPALQLYDAMSGDWHKLRIKKRSTCPACGTASPDNS
jgi:adenylyltransferase/sulfurtransferase